MNVANYAGGFLLLFSLGALCWRLPAVFAARRPHGIRVYLPRQCDERDGFNNRTVVLYLHDDGSFEINSTAVSHKALGPMMAEIFAKRQERVLRLVADRKTSYGDVIFTIAQTKAHVPNLVILLVDDSPDAAWNACISSKDIRPEDL